MTTETTTIYITKYALSDGIRKHEANIGSGGFAKFDVNGWSNLISESAYVLTPEDAVKQAEASRLKKIASLKKQIAKLEKLTFSVESIR